MKFFPAAKVVGLGCMFVASNVCSAISDSIVVDGALAQANELEASMPVSSGDVSGVWTDHVFVKVRGGVAAEAISVGTSDVRIAGLLARWSVTRVHPALVEPARDPVAAAKFGIDRFYVLDVPSGSDTRAMAAEFAQVADVFELAEVDPVGTLHTDPTDPGFAQQWSLHNVGQPIAGLSGIVDADIDWLEAWQTPNAAVSVVIALLDTGVSMSHPDLAGQTIPGRCFSCGTNFNNTDDEPQLSHGTLCAGIAAAATNNGIGMAGVCPRAKIMPIKVVGANGLFVSQHWTGNGLIWAADNGASIASMSWGFDSAASVPFLRSAIEYAHNRGVLLISSTGNDPTAFVGIPARYNEVIAVGATDSQDRAFPGQTTGAEMDVVAPGVMIYTTVDQTSTPNNYTLATGTSMSVPMVAGVAAIVWGAKPTLSAAEVRAVIESSVDDLGETGLDSIFGWGRLNARRALMMVLPPTPLCPSDLNRDGTADLGDLFLFLTTYFGSYGQTGTDLPADFDHNGVISVEDMFAFMALWFGGC